jgi:hypothetical protein
LDEVAERQQCGLNLHVRAPLQRGEADQETRAGVPFALRCTSAEGDLSGLKPGLKSLYKAVSLPKLNGKFIDAVLRKKPRFLSIGAENIYAARDVVVVPIM